LAFIFINIIIIDLIIEENIIEVFGAIYTPFLQNLF